MKYLLSIVLLSTLNLNAQKLTEIWEVEGLEAPESIVYDSNSDVYYVSNVSGQPAEKNGKGFISIVNSSGELKTKQWITGFNAPKGLGLYYNHLFIADIDQVVVVDVIKGEIIKRFNAEGATFLNDIDISSDGSVYVSDTFGGNAIYKIKDDTITLWLKSEDLNFPNGLEIVNNKLYVSSWGVVTNPETFGTEVPGKLIEVDINTKEIKTLTKSIGNLDGLVAVNNGFIVSDWIDGSLLSIDKSGNSSKIKDLDAGSADFYYNLTERIILIPIMLENKLLAFKIN
ncbi:MAG: GTP-binding protein [Winogradskyella sp.]|uniref:hypothetical protein n=1 Tax=Winogradskyella sp. TaxID=1883156 RepID=UPI000F40D1B5|nr:hypothetical protein [Winogradskyella sp.]RNC87266.1 MAG: GTP-binding protein [Winogradskyella sp.]